MTGSQTGSGSWFGRPVLISPDGQTIAVGASDLAGYAPVANHGPGSVYLFTHNGSAWVETQKLNAADPLADAEFGWGLAFNDASDMLLIGSPGRTESGNSRQGASYLFDLNGGIWSEVAKLSATDGGADDQFGYAVAFASEQLLCGANGDDDVASNSGAVYYFNRSGQTMTDCNNNGVDDADDISGGTSVDCNGNGIPDECEIGGDPADDCDSDGITDLCEIYNGAGDCNTNNIPDTCDVDDGTSEDWNWDYIPDECQDFSGGSTLNDPDSWDSYQPGYWGLGGQGYNCSWLQRHHLRWLVHLLCAWPRCGGAAYPDASL